MAATVQLTDGTTTINLSGGTGTITGCTYRPTPVTVAEAMTGVPVDDAVSIDLQGTAANMLADLDSIEQLLAAADRRGRLRTGARVYLQYQTASGEDTHRSEVAGGMVEVHSQPDRRRYSDGFMTVPLTITRRPYWEGPEATLVNGTTIANGESGNYVDISAANVEGTLAAPMKLQIENNTGASRSYSNIYVSANAFNDPTNYDGFLTGENLTWSPSADHSSTQKTWSLSSAMLIDQAGDRFHVLAAFSTLTTNAYWQAHSVISLNTMEDTFEVPGDDADIEVLDLGTLRLPPGGDNTAGSLVDITLSVRYASSGSGNLDFVQLLPAAEFRHIEQTAYQVPAAARIVDDGIEDRLYVSSGGNQWSLLVPAGDPPRLWPGRDNRVYVLMDCSDGFDATYSSKIYISYRPRRAVL